jgi:predicted ATPase
MKKVVFVGGSHCGKTTLLEHYKSAGYQAVPEAAMLVTAELKEKMGLEQYRDWRSKNPAKFFGLISEKQMEFEQNAPSDSSILFLDRGVPDMIAICRYHGATLPERTLAYPETHRYDFVFLCELLDHFDDRPETGRMHTQEDSHRIVELIYEEYKKYGYDPIRLAPVSVEERTKVINQTLGL